MLPDLFKVKSTSTVWSLGNWAKLSEGPSHGDSSHHVLLVIPEQVRPQQQNPWVYWGERRGVSSLSLNSSLFSWNKVSICHWKVTQSCLESGIIGLFHLHAYTPQNVHVRLWVNTLSSDLRVTYRESHAPAKSALCCGSAVWMWESGSMWKTTAVALVDWGGRSGGWEKKT